ncbi:DUF389 domain-containing protein [Phytohalomonas tamaricis]|uniref:DUF389 domain-containing protein n=1 Tax=Phytohalomonas tamaricis TaxID=2081032 RepID=UPI000D0B5F92|nr:DUF389 domain-containing protein [Phytohalomonas tamaricis]
MPRSIEVSTTSERIDAILRRIEEDGVEGVVSLARHRGASLTPPGDVLSIQLTNEATRPIITILADFDVAAEGSVHTSESSSLMSAGQQQQISKESNETVWDEMAFLLRRDTNLSFNYLAAMTLAGAVAAGGLWTDLLHVIVGAMIIAPAFEPLVRIPFGMITRAKELIPSGFASVAAGYLCLAAGAALTTSILELWNGGAPPGLAQQQWMTYWSSVSFPGVLLSIFGGIAGAVIICAQRGVMTVGVMITLALIPSMAVVGIGIVVGDFSLAWNGFIRWLVDVALVVAMSIVVFGGKKLILHRRVHALS